MTNHIASVILLALLSFVYPTGEPGRPAPVGTTYYFSATGSDGNAGTSAGAPFQTLTKLNALLANAVAGDQFLLKKGDTFSGTITMSNRNGVSGSEILISSYGTGANPVISGMTSLASWTNSSGNIWQAVLPSSPARLQVVTIGGTPTMRGRFPNPGSNSNGGYLRTGSHSGYTVVNDNGAYDPGAVSWVGAELTLRSNRWMLNTYPITYQQMGATLILGYTGSQAEMSQEPLDGFGYFFQNSLAALDVQGEWFCPNGTNIIKMYSAINPGLQGVRVAVQDKLISLGSCTYVTVQGLSLEGANSTGVYAVTGNHLTVKDCSINFSGNKGIKMDQCPYSLVQNNQVNNSYNIGIDVTPFCSNSSIRYNTVQASGVLIGLQQNGNLAAIGVFGHGDNFIMEYNNVINCGYNGMVMTGSHITIRNNYINGFCLNTDDGAGIYTSGEGSDRNILNNIVINGPGNYYGTNSGPELNAGNAIGLDEMSENVLIDGNTGAFCSREGVGLHNTKDVVISNNTFYSIDDRVLGWGHTINEPDNPIRNINVNHNIFFATKRTARLTRFDTRRDYDDLLQFGTSDYNYWMSPTYPGSDFFLMSYRHIPPGVTVGPSQSDSDVYRIYVTKDFAHWQSDFGQDAHSVTNTFTYAPDIVTTIGGNLYPGGQFNGNVNNVLLPENATTKTYDPTGGIDGGSLKLSNTTGGGGIIAWLYDASNVQTFFAGHSYRLKFSVKGSGDNADFFAIAYSSTASAQSDQMNFKVYSTRKDVTITFTPSMDIPGHYIAIGTQNAAACNTVWLDNITEQEITSTPNLPFQLVYNETGTPKTIITNAPYVDVAGNRLGAKFVLQPYTSKIMMRNANAIRIGGKINIH